jgi:hypothetical protein
MISKPIDLIVSNVMHDVLDTIRPPIEDMPTADDETAQARRAITTATDVSMLEHVRTSYSDADWEAPLFDDRMDDLEMIQRSGRR